VLSDVTAALLSTVLLFWGGEPEQLDKDDSEASVVEDDALADASLTPIDDEPVAPKREWVEHRVVPQEKYEDIGLRYGVSREEIVKWNKKRLGSKQWIYAGMKLKIWARKQAPPRQKIKYRVAFGDTWAEIATKFNVPVAHLRAWNKSVPKQFNAGTPLTIYTNPKAVAGTVDGRAPIPELSVRENGLAIGSPHRGKLANGVRLPDSKLYTVRDPDKAFGTSHAVKTIHSAIATFRRDTGYAGKVIIADLSKQGGGRMRPHKSHQVGRDADIRLPRKPGASQKDGSPSTVDWDMSWQLIKAFIDTGQVEYIFLDYSRQKYLMQAARDAGVSGKDLERYLQYPQGSRKNKGVVRHSKGHNIHIHVRVKCAPGNSRCVTW
jgi:murein endopeptidase